jgi:hypothetical protein
VINLTEGELMSGYKRLFKKSNGEYVEITQGVDVKVILSCPGDFDDSPGDDGENTGFSDSIKDFLVNLQEDQIIDIKVISVNKRAVCTIFYRTLHKIGIDAEYFKQNGGNEETGECKDDLS